MGSSKAYIVRTDSLLNLKPVGIFGNEETLEDHQLFQNYPNPFNSNFKIDLTLAKNSEVKIEMFDLSGRLIEKIEHSVLNQGEYNYVVNSSELSSGIYFLKIKTNFQVFNKKNNIN